MKLTIAVVVLFALPAIALAPSASATAPPGLPAPIADLATRERAARGPLALSVAAEQLGLHWGLETGFPLGLARRDAAGRPFRAESPWRLDALCNASHDPRDARDSGWLATSLRLERADTRGVNWLGVSRGGPREVGDPDARLRLGLGRVQPLRGVRAEASWVTSSVLFKNDPRWTTTVREHLPSWPESLGFVTRTVPRSHAALWHTAQGALHWQGGQLSLEGVGGLSVGEGVRARRWAQVALGAKLSRRVTFQASWGERPAPALAFSGGAQPRTMLGVQLSPWAGRERGANGASIAHVSAWRATLLGPGRVMVRVRARDAERVELAGDFTDWSAVALADVHAGWWAAVVKVPAGVHRVQVRVDGGRWYAPPGLPRADDGPGGPSGAWIVLADETRQR